MATIHDSTTGDTTDVVPVEELVGCSVLGRDGERIGTVRDVVLDEHDRVVMLRVRERWMLGPQHEVPASGMRLADGVVHVPTTRRVIADRADLVREPRPSAPIVVSGAAGARPRYGGFDLPATLVGALATIGSLVLVGGVLAAIFGTDPAVIDTNDGTFAQVTSGAMLVGFTAIFLSFLIGGWATGRSSRFDGVSNSLVTVVWVLAVGVVLGALGSWANERYDVYASTDLPSFQADDAALWGSIAFVVAFALMFAGAAIGGAIGEAWHRRADRAMLGDATPRTRV